MSIPNPITTGNLSAKSLAICEEFKTALILLRKASARIYEAPVYEIGVIPDPRGAEAHAMYAAAKLISDQALCAGALSPIVWQYVIRSLSTKLGRYRTAVHRTASLEQNGRGGGAYEEELKARTRLFGAFVEIVHKNERNAQW